MDIRNGFNQYLTIGKSVIPIPSQNQSILVCLHLVPKSGGLPAAKDGNVYEILSLNVFGLPSVMLTNLFDWRDAYEAASDSSSKNRFIGTSVFVNTDCRIVEK